MTINKSVPLAVLPALSLVVGWIDYGPLRRSPYTNLSGYAYGLAVVLLLCAWCWLDARGRNVQPSKIKLAAFAAFTVFALPAYLFKTRGARRGAKALALALLMFVFTLTCYGIGATAARY